VEIRDNCTKETIIAHDQELCGMHHSTTRHTEVERRNTEYNVTNRQVQFNNITPISNISAFLKFDENMTKE